MKKSIVVTSYRSGMGKTTFMCRFLRMFPQWAAVKIITYHTHKMPEELADTGFDIVTNREILSQKGTDTGRMYEIIGDKVLWVRTSPGKSQEAFTELFARLEKFDSVIMEGTSVLLFHKPDKSIMLVDDKDKKPSVQKVLDQIDIFLPALDFFSSDKEISLTDEQKKRYLNLDWNHDESFQKLITIGKIGR